MASAAQLDSEELFRLALLDVQASRHDQAILKLKELVAMTPEDARAHFLLAAEHAELGLYDRAEQGMTRALALDPSLHTARFQLGLLHYTRGDTTQAAAAWAPLDDLGNREALVLFKSGLLKLATDELEAAERELGEALELAQGNPALAKDIANVLDNLRQRRKDSPAAPVGTETPVRSSAAGLLNRYDDAAQAEQE